MIIQNLDELTPVKQRAIIINFNTKHVTFLALLSALRYSGVPVLLIDCESTDGSYEFFKSLTGKYQFDLMSAPLKKHGVTLDWIFSNTRDEELLLLDSDLEILGIEIIEFMNRHIDEPLVFGSGFVNGPSLLHGPDFNGTALEGALYFERPFMPIALFKVSYVREALKAGRSFRDAIVENEFALIPSMLFKRITRKVLKIIKMKSPLSIRKQYLSTYPPKIFYDTGGRIYEYLRYERMLFFVNLPEPVHPKYVFHFWGTTRNSINPNDSHVGNLVATVQDIVSERLTSVYQESV
jgi:hypothetical protein